MIERGCYESLYVVRDYAHAVSDAAGRKALQRTVDAEFGGPAWWMNIRRTDSNSMIVATGSPCGSLRPFTEQLDALDAFELVRTVGLALPGLTRSPSYRRGCSPAPPQSSNFRRYAAGLSDSEANLFYARSNSESRRLFDRSFELLSPERMDLVAKRVLKDMRRS